MSAEWFITGGNGFIGAHLIRRLRADGIGVRALARSDASAAALTELGATVVRGDLDDVRAWAGALDGVTVVAHLAAVHPPEWRAAEYERVNVTALRALVAECATRPVRFIHISSEAAVLVGKPLVNVDESAPLALKSKSLYARSKARGEVIVTEACAAGLDGVILRPRFVWGPGDHSMAAVLESVEAGKFKMIGDGTQRTSTTHVDNLVEAILLAATNGGTGAAYFIADAGTIEFGRMAANMLAALGHEMPTGSISFKSADLLARTIEFAWRLPLFKTPPPLTRTMVWLLGLESTLDTTRAERELGYRPTTSREDGYAGLAAATAEHR